MEPIVERAKREDLAGIARIHVDCWREIYTFLPDAVHKARNLTHRYEQWEEVLVQNRPNELLLAVRLDNDLVGFAHANDEGDPDIPTAKALFNAAYFKPEVRKLSVGVYVMDAMVNFAIERDLWPACLWAFEKNPGRDRNAAAGWREVVRRDRVIDKIAIPEVGYLSPDTPAELYGRMNRRLAAAHAPRALDAPTLTPDRTETRARSKQNERLPELSK